MTIIHYKCKNCDFDFTDESLIFHINGNMLKEEPLTPESSKKMDKAEIAGYLYVGYCNKCKNYIKTYIIETEMENPKEIIEKLEKLIDKKLTKILYFDFNKTSFQYRRGIITKNTCPECNNQMSLLVDEFHLCPKCMKNTIETIME